VVELELSYPLLCDMCNALNRVMQWVGICALEESAIEKHPRCRMVEETLHGYEIPSSRQPVAWSKLLSFQLLIFSHRVEI
jgi:hypothetical protein